MKTGTKLHFFNTDYGEITEYFIGGSYYLPDSSEFFIIRNNEKYILMDSDKQYVSGPKNGKWTILPIYDLDSLKQNLEARCSIVKGDALYNTRLGIPLGLPLQDTKLSVLNTISNTYGVRSCQVLRNYISNKKYVMDIQIHSNLGDVVITI